MIPAPGRQNPHPYFEAADSRNRNTSLFSPSASLMSLSPSVLARMRWSQCMVVGRLACRSPAEMNWSITIWPVTSWSATLSGLRNT